MTEEQFDRMLEAMLERPVEKMTDQELVDSVSVTQAAFDRQLNDLERRGLLGFLGGAPIIPCMIPESREVETILTRPSTRSAM